MPPARRLRSIRRASCGSNPLTSSSAISISVRPRGRLRRSRPTPSRSSRATRRAGARDTTCVMRDGIVWSVKLGPEAQAEVVASRLLWAIGFHQPPTYYLRAWTLSGPGAGPQEGGRFRPETDAWKAAGDWNWAEFPHSSDPATGGLLVAQMLINNWDLKTSNNKLIERAKGSSGPPRLYVVRDLGASLGSNEQAKWLRWTQLRIAQGSEERSRGLRRVAVRRRRRGRLRQVLGTAAPISISSAASRRAHVQWTAKLLARLSDRQWHDAFRAGGYSPADAERYIAKFKEKIAEGLALRWAGKSGMFLPYQPHPPVTSSQAPVGPTRSARRDTRCGLPRAGSRAARFAHLCRSAPPRTGRLTRLPISLLQAIAIRGEVLEALVPRDVTRRRGIHRPIVVRPLHACT